MFNSTTCSQTPVTKMGPWGGNGGTSFDIPDIPLSIQTVTIRCSDVINSLAFSYVNQAGQKKNVGPWGGDGALAVTVSYFKFYLSTHCNLYMYIQGKILLYKLTTHFVVDHACSFRDCESSYGNN
jgi:hypothetical protein